ncbi:hypothetical protein [uncultured Mycobacterium sp.]|uniref:hypothetical protein n=1 Tax=uncultured Mycobacterium sp. TaxID=171292 RepID=UPI0035CA42B8
MTGAGIPTRCTQCAATLGAHNLTGLCAECKLIARNTRAGHPSQHETVTKTRALANLAAILGAKPLTIERAAP